MEGQVRIPGANGRLLREKPCAATLLRRVAKDLGDLITLSAVQDRKRKKVSAILAGDRRNTDASKRG